MIDEEETPQDEEPKDETPKDEAPQEEEASGVSPQASGEEAPAEEAPAPAEEEAAPAEEEPAPAEEEPAPADEEAPAEEEAAPAAEEKPAAEDKPDRPKPAKKKDEPEVIPGADLEPDLVLEDAGPDPALLRGDAAAEVEAAEQSFEEADEAVGGDEEPDRAVTTVLELAADARYQATGKRKHAIARVILKPGKGEYEVNGRELAEFFPRPTLQKVARGPLDATGQQERLDVVAKIKGGGVSAQAGALRHGIAKALIEADPALRGELKRRGYLTRDPRVKERKKAGLKKARKRPQFSKR